MNFEEKEANSEISNNTSEIKNISNVSNSKCDEIESDYDETDEQYLDVAEDIIIEERIDSMNNESDNFNKLIQRQKQELALELRRLQYGDRPVTSTETKNRIEEFFSASTVGENGAATTSGANSSTPLITYRSPAILNEISELGSQQRVSSLLTNNRDLFERSLQHLIQNRQTINQRVVPPQTVPIQTVPIQTVPIQIVPIQTVPTQRVPTVRQENNATPNRRIPPFLETRNLNTNSIEEITREQIITEISELVHNQLVTNALQNNEFRSRLEQRVLDRMRISGIDGTPARNTIRQLALNTNSNIQRNDFSHLGIGQQQLDDISDSASTSHATNTRHTTKIIHNSREIKELKTEILELKNMIKLSFDVTLDMQRAFRQEISALVSGTFQNSTSANLIQNTRAANEGKCLICTENDIDSVFYSCGHLACCYKCSLQLKQKGHNCCVCRAPIKDILRTYKCNME